ncbi:MAG TPA: hypothetical protein VHF07_04670, partial [Nitrospiraceae bacterium]|nr:hypothetical protein [Nitrospiraceae bacterium]
MVGWRIGFCILIGLFGSGMLSAAQAAEPQAGQDGQKRSFEVTKGKDGAPMVLVPAGPFTMGSNDGLPNER